MGRVIVRRRIRPPGAPAYSATGFTRFFDILLQHGLEYFGLYYGVYRAEVIDLNDSESGQVDAQGRLWVRVPSVGDTRDARRLAYPLAELAGPNYGLKTIPPQGGYVYVVFENGKLDIPLWFKGWWGSGDIPAELQPNESHWWITPQGHRIVMDGQDGQSFILIKHLDGETRVELDAEGNVFVVNKAGQKVNIGDGADTANEPAALGNTLKGLLEEMCDQLANLTVPTPAGPSGNPVNRPAFESIKGRLSQILSQTVNVK